MQMWGSSHWGQSFTATAQWQLRLIQDEFRLVVGGRSYQGSVGLLEGATVTPGIVWASVVFRLANQQPIMVDGIPNAEAQAMERSLAKARADLKHKELVRSQIAGFDRDVRPILAWHEETTRDMAGLLATHRWLTHEHLQQWLASKPPSNIRFNLPEISAHVGQQGQSVKEAVKLWTLDLPALVQELNRGHLAKELSECKSLFDTVEKSPLTEEQARAVVTFENRVQVVASAGSGKTSTMVAKAAYALHRKLLPADSILMLAFNRDAAQQLQARVTERLGPLNLDAEKVVARTFHRFGLDVIGQATGERPTLAPWVESGADVKHLVELIDQLKDRDAGFRAQWDLFRVVLGRDLPAFGQEEKQPEDWDTATKATGFRTLNGEVVKSQGERLIADWLFYNGVNYRYEAPYAVSTADPTHRQYRPDFYYPDIDAYHEHWALDDDGNPPADFVGYRQSMEWKKQLHATHQTTLLETTMADLWSGKAFKQLEGQLKELGLKLDPNPEREAPGRPVLLNEDLARTFRVFLIHAKSNRFSSADLKKRLEERAAGQFYFRHKVFLALFDSISTAWEASLRCERVIDFEDMLNLAADHLEAGRWESPYQLVMVDEFQDASRARARLTRALVQKPGRFLFAVGDDWQSINRFAGSDLSVMTEFNEWFGPGETLRLERTFRCPQTLCDISGHFVQKNPAQLRKKVVSKTPAQGPAVRILEVDDETKLLPGVSSVLQALHRDVEAGAIALGKSGKVSVFLLGRYRRDQEYQPRSTPWPRLDLSFSTIHGAKGLEADYVIVPRLMGGTYGFPSKIEDDPVLNLAMPETDPHPHAEERRLFYVALTRARRGVTLLTVANRPSEFATELIKDHQLQVVGLDGKPASAMPCPAHGCGGALVRRNGRFGPFLGCSNYPRCKRTIDLKPKASDEPTRRPGR